MVILTNVGGYHMHIDLKDIGIVKDCLITLARVYNHPNSNKYTRDFIRFELQRILGPEYDIKKFLNDPQCKV